MNKYALVNSKLKIDVTIAGADDCENFKLALGTVVVPNKSLHNIKGILYDAVIIPGGMGGVKALANVCTEYL